MRACPAVTGRIPGLIHGFRTCAHALPLIFAALPATDEEEPVAPGGADNNGGGRVVLENTSPLPGLLGPLVDYGEDDDEEGDTLPLRGDPGWRLCTCYLCRMPAMSWWLKGWVASA